MKTTENLFNRLGDLQREATMFRFAQRFKKINVPFINVSYEYKEPKDTLSVGKMYVVFEVEKWAEKILNNPITGLKSIDYTRVTNNNTRKVAMLYS
jgi:hypothetical protein